MDICAKTALVVGLFSMSFMLNLPFGFFRQRTRKFSLMWFVCIHLPIPFIVIGRLFSGIEAYFIPIFIFSAVLGQVFGGKLDIN